MTAPPPHYRQVGDTLVGISAQLKRPGGNPVILTDATVQFSLLDEQNSPKVDKKAANIDDPARGKVSYDFEPTDVDTVGNYTAQWLVTDAASSETETIPPNNDDRQPVIIQD